MDTTTAETRFNKIGLDPNVIKNTLANPKVTASLLTVLDFANLNECSKKIGNLLYAVATKTTAVTENRRKLLAEYVTAGKIESSQQLDLALEYLKAKAGVEKIDTNEFEKSIGVGVVITDDDIKKVIKEHLDKDKEQLIKDRYLTDISKEAFFANILELLTGGYLAKIRSALPFANGALITKYWNEALLALLGPKTAEDDKKRDEAKKLLAKEKKKTEKEEPKEEVKEEKDVPEEENSKKLKLSNLSARDLVSSINPPEILKKHLEATGGKIYTRFPPEPNGYIHIGHAFAMRFNFNLASENGGETYLRFDDTNPEKESLEYIESIKENVNWLGYKPFKVTFASDYFEDLYKFAVQLIKQGDAYVCHQTKEEMSEFRSKGLESPWRNRRVEDNLREFEAMRMGKYEEGKAMLRLKLDMKHPNTTMRDPVAYRIKYVPHPHIGSKWCIYPMYDYTHCINDSLENITYSCCTLEFEIRRELYYETLKLLNLYRPHVWEFSRLNVSNNVVSKRKLQALIFGKYVNGWDDPRLLSIFGLRRRGYTASAINDFCDLMHVTRKGNENIISYTLMEHCLRKELDKTAERTMAIIDPVKLVLVNVPEDFKFECKAHFFPKEPEKGTYTMTLTKENYIDRSDIRIKDSKDFYGFAVNKVVGLKYAFPVRVTAIETGADEEITLVRAELLKDSKEKPKSYVSWVPANESIEIETRLYDVLFNSLAPNQEPDFLSTLNPNSLVEHKNSRIHAHVNDFKVGKHYQFERFGFFVVDNDTNTETKRLVFNRSVTLVEKNKPKEQE